MQKIPQEKKIQKLVEKGNAAEAQEVIKARTNEFIKRWLIRRKDQAFFQ
jgi:hypothetical protein